MKEPGVSCCRPYICVMYICFCLEFWRQHERAQNMESHCVCFLSELENSLLLNSNDQTMFQKCWNILIIAFVVGNNRVSGAVDFKWWIIYSTSWIISIHENILLIITKSTLRKRKIRKRWQGNLKQLFMPPLIIYVVFVEYL